MALAIYTSAAVEDNDGITPAANATVEVRDESTANLAQIFEDRDGNTAAANPFNADSLGRFSFYAVGGVYQVTVTDSSANEHVLRHQAIGTAAEADFLDEDDLSSDSAVSVPSQQSVKSYVDNLNPFITAADETSTNNLTWHEDNPSVAAQTYTTIFDISGGPVQMLGGNITSTRLGYRLTIDGAIVIHRTGTWEGHDAAGNDFDVISLPAARGESSMKLEAYNSSTLARQVGWRVVTR